MNPQPHLLKKRTLKLCFGLGLTLAAPVAEAQPAYFQAVTNLNPVAYWPLQESTQPPVADIETNLGTLGAAGNAYYASTNAVKGFGPTATGDGDTAVNFLGNNQSFMLVPTTDNRISLPPGEPFSVEAWVNPAGNQQYVAIVGQTGPFNAAGLNGVAGNAGWLLGQNFLPYIGSPAWANSLVGWSFHVFNGVGSGGAEADASFDFTINSWYHVVGVYDGTNCTVYVNGTDATTGRIPMTGAFVPDTWDPLLFGANRNLGANPYHGGIDEVAIYTNALSAAQVAAHFASVGSGTYSSTVLGDQPYMYWRMDSPAYTTPSGSSFPSGSNLGSDTDPSLTGLYEPGTVPGSPGPQSPAMGSASYACAFNGIGGALPAMTNNSPFSNPLNVTNQSISVACWFKGNPADTDLRFQNLVSHGNNGWRLGLGNGGNAGHIQWNFGAGSDLVSAWPYNDGNWHLVVGVYTNAGPASPAGWLGTNYLYVDGVLDNSAAITNSQTAVPNLNLLIGGAPDAIYIQTNSWYNAANPNGRYNPGQRYLAGSLAHVAFFTNALTTAQIQSLYNVAMSNSAPRIVAQPFNGIRTNSGGPGTFIFFGVVASGTYTTFLSMVPHERQRHHRFVR